MLVSIPADLFELVTKFLQNKRTEITALEPALATGDFESIRHFAHKIRGVGKMYGFPEISQIGDLLEEAARGSDAPETAKQFQRMKEYLHSVTIKLEGAP